MFVRSNPSSNHKHSGTIYKPGHAVKVKSAGQLLHGRHHQQLIEQLEQLARMPVAYFDVSYVALIERFTEYVQVIPSSPRKGLSSLLNDSLFTAFYNLKEADAEMKDHASPLFRYALFSASLLRRVAYIVEKYRFVLTNEQGLYVKDWTMFDGTMLENDGEYFKMYPIGYILSRNHAILTGMLVNLLMPKAGLDWIVSDTELFHEWLSCLESEDYGEGRLGKAIKKYWLHEDQLINPLSEVDVELLETPDTQHGEAFYTWLKNGLADGSIKVNAGDAFVHHVNSGIFIEYPGLIRDFVTKVYNVPVNMNVVFEQFGNLFGLVMLSGDDYRNKQFFSDYPGVTSDHSSGLLSRPATTIRQGMVVSDASKIFVDGNTPAKSRFLRATEKSTPTANALPAIAKQQSTQPRLQPRKR